MTINIAFFDTKPYDRKSFDRMAEKYDFEITYYETRLNRQTANLTKGHNVVCAFVNDSIDEKTIDELYENGVRLIALRCAGFNNVDFKAAHGKIHIVRVPAYSPHAVAEYAMALLMTLNRKIHKAYSRTRDGNFSINGLLGFDMYGKTAGVIGTGKIGRCMIDICLGFGMNVVAYDPFPDEEYAAEKGIEMVSLNELYRNSDVISLHCPLTPETQHIINSHSINLMRQGVTIINTSRGKLIHTDSLINGLKSGKISGAGLDVYEEESDYFFEDLSTELIADDTLARLMTFPNVLVTSHQGFFTQEALENIALTTLNNIQEFAEEKQLTNEVCYQCDEPCEREVGKPCF